MGIAVGGLLSFTDEYYGLVAGGFMESVRSTDGGGSGFSDREERLANPSDLAPEGRAGLIAHPGLFFGVCFMDDIGSDGEMLRLG